MAQPVRQSEGNMNQADRIRACAKELFVEPARRKRQTTLEVVARDVARELGLSNRMPNVCSALQSSKFLEMAGVELLDPKPTKPAATARFRYAIRPSGAAEKPAGALASARRPPAIATMDWREAVPNQPRAARKQPTAGSLLAEDGTPVHFVANPAATPHKPNVAEGIYAALSNSLDKELAKTFSDRLNQFFRDQGIDWQMEGVVQRRGLDSFTHSVKVGESSLSSTGRSRAATELAEAVRDISRRPQPDTTGAVQHAMAALEATARDVTGQTKPTLGQLIDSLELPPPLDTAVAKLWGYASNEARHGREGSTLSAADAELIVGVSGAICGFLATRPTDRRP